MTAPVMYVLDIECSPNVVYAWSLWDLKVGINQIIEPQDIISFAAHRIGTKTIEAHAAWDGYEAMLNRLHEIMDSADYVIGYNQIGFDNKHIRAAFAKAGMPPPAPWRDIDLLRVVKKNFRFPSHKLEYVCKALNLDAKMQTGGFELWTACMNGDEKAQRKMLRYNKMDVQITTQLYHRLLPYVEGLNVPMFDSGGNGTATNPAGARCTRCGGEQIHSRGWAYTTTTRYKRFQCRGCGGWMRAAKSEPLGRELLRNV